MRGNLLYGLYVSTVMLLIGTANMCPDTLFVQLFFSFLRCFSFSFFAGLLDIPCEVEGITSIITLKRLIGLIHLPVRACPLDGNELILLNMGPTT